MFSAVDHFEMFKPGSVNLTVVLNTDQASYLQTFRSFDIETFYVSDYVYIGCKNPTILNKTIV